MYLKKLLFVVLSAFLMCTTVSAMDLIQWTICPYENEQPIGNGYPKSPNDPPTVYIEDYTLTFKSYHPAYVLVLKDENGDTVYTTVVHITQTEVELPSTLSGNYEIRLVLGIWRFTGWINL